jgi:DNA-binding NarL/FixJ family response regulator
VKRIALVDDHSLFRAGMRMLLESLDSYEVIAEASTASQALNDFPRLAPSIVLIDISLPDMSGIELLRSMRQSTWSEGIPKFVILSMHSQRDFVVRAFEVGADGYFLKESAPEQLERGLDKILADELWVSEQLGDYQDYLGVVDEALNLTVRQLEVLRHLASGHNVKTIAFELGISPKTVQTFRTQIMERLKLNDLPSLVRFAIRHGIVTS